MRRLIPALALLAAPLLGSAPAVACAQPQEGEPQCWCEPPLVSVTVGDTTYSVHDPTKVQICP